MEILNEKNALELNKFIGLHGRFMHTLEWKEAIEKTYKNCKSNYFIDIKDGKILGFFPFFNVNSSMFGNRIISQPFCDFGGPLGELSEKFMKEILESLKKDFGKDSRFIEVRLNNFISGYEDYEKILINAGFKKETRRQQFILKIEDENALWEKFDRITKKGIKKAEKSELNIKEMNKNEIIVFYELYLKSMKSFGTPQHSIDYFLNLFESGLFKGLTCYKDGKLISSLIVFYNGNYMYAAYNFSEHEYLKFQPNDLLYWEIIKWASKNGIKFFDFGQVESNAPEGSHASGIFKFKEKWAGELVDRPYFYYYFGKNEGKTSDKKGKYEKMIKIWQKLPLSIIKIAGPKISSQLAL